LTGELFALDEDASGGDEGEDGRITRVCAATAVGEGGAVVEAIEESFI
jgi:hypothetical protein